MGTYTAEGAEWVLLRLAAAYISFGPPRIPVGFDLLESSATTESRLS